MTPDQANASAVRFLSDTLQIMTSSGWSTPLRCRVTGFQPNDVVVDMQEGDRKVLLLADDVAALGSGVLKRTGRLLWNGKTLTVKSIDDASRRVSGVLVAYELQVSGA